MFFVYSTIACVIGFLIEIFIGCPYWLYHPIRLIGNLISKTEKYTRNLFGNNQKGELIGGIVMVAIVCAVTTIVTAIIVIGCYKVNIYFGVLIESIICYFMIATKELKNESMKVYDKLIQNDIQGSRKAVSMIVGRDTQNLDEQGVTKATVETIAENLSDGVIAPIIFILIGGAVGGAFYKAVNTMDSMIGYKNDKYLYYGRFAAKVDDILNFVPSRISAIMMIFASFLAGYDYKNAIKIFKRDRFNHASPNSAQTESVCAGALQIQLAGNSYYFGKLYEKPFIGDKIQEVKPQNIVDANKLMYYSAFLTVLIFVIIKVLIFIFLF